jgi:hypothetical protein
VIANKSRSTKLGGAHVARVGELPVKDLVTALSMQVVEEALAPVVDPWTPCGYNETLKRGRGGDGAGCSVTVASDDDAVCGRRRGSGGEIQEPEGGSGSNKLHFAFCACAYGLFIVG